MGGQRHDSKDLLKTPLLASKIPNCILHGVDRHVCPVSSRSAVGLTAKAVSSRIHHQYGLEEENWTASHFQVCNGKFLPAA